jgi:hypothetical protein
VSSWIIQFPTVNDNTHSLVLANYQRLISGALRSILVLSGFVSSQIELSPPATSVIGYCCHCNHANAPPSYSRAYGAVQGSPITKVASIRYLTLYVTYLLPRSYHQCTGTPSQPCLACPLLPPLAAHYCSSYEYHPLTSSPAQDNRYPPIQASTPSKVHVPPSSLDLHTPLIQRLLHKLSTFPRFLSPSSPPLFQPFIFSPSTYLISLSHTFAFVPHYRRYGRPPRADQYALANIQPRLLPTALHFSFKLFRTSPTTIAT